MRNFPGPFQTRPPSPPLSLEVGPFKFSYSMIGYLGERCELPERGVSEIEFGAF